MNFNLRIASYNVENLEKNQENTDDPYSYENKLFALSRVVDEINADIIGFQELGGREELEELNKCLDQSYPHVEITSGNSHRNNFLGFLSRYPLKTTSHRKVKLKDLNGDHVMEYASPHHLKPSSCKFRRDLFQADVLLDNKVIATVFNLHLKSNITYTWTQNSPEVIRLAESNTAAGLITQHNDSVNYPVVVMGDLNERPGELSISPLHPHMGFCDIIESDYNSETYDETYTFHSKRFRSRLDHILLSPIAMKHYCKKSITIFNEEHAKQASDHLPIYIDLTIQS